MIERELAEVASAFQVEGVCTCVSAHGSGHINHSYRATFAQHAGPERHYLLQRINTGVFRQPDLLMENVQRVTKHLQAKLSAVQDAGRRVLTIVPALSGVPWHRDGSGGVWRMFHFIDGAVTFDSVESPAQAYAAAFAFGDFQRRLADLPSPRLHETIPGFHDTPARVQRLEQTVADDPAGRAGQASGEITFALSRRGIAHLLLGAGLPERVTHNDTKLNNVMFDTGSGESLCVVDLDTVMPGLAAYDFGDMVRTATSASQEDETDLSRVAVQFPLFKALVSGYLGSAGAFLTRNEVDLLPASGKLICYEQGVRFLTDYLAGDTYYKVSHPRQNLDRCRTQFRLVESIEAQQAEMERLVRSL